MEAGEGSNGQDGQGGRTPPEEEQIRMGRARVARGLPPEESDPAGVQGLLAGSGAGDRGVPPGTPPNLPPGSTAEPADATSRLRPWSEPAPSASGPIRCHFLRSVGPDGRLTDPQKTAVPTHRCAAFGDPLPLSLRQQELVCLQRVHVSCPRYVRGTVLANEGAAAAVSQVDKANSRLTTVAAVVVVIAAVGILLTGPVLGVLPFGGAGRPSQVVMVVSPSPDGTAVTGPTSAHTATLAPSAATAPVATPTSLATPVSTRTPAPTPVPTSSWPQGATASRMTLVVPCSDQPNCYLYTVRGAGQNGSPVADTLQGIADFFGVRLAQIRQMNPSLGGSDVITPGDKLKIPPPTR